MDESITFQILMLVFVIGVPLGLIQIIKRMED